MPTYTASSTATFAAVQTAADGLYFGDIFLRPASDIDIGLWTDESLGTSNIYQSIDEEVASDSDYIRSEDVTGSSLSPCEIGHSSTGATKLSGKKVRYRYSTNGGTVPLDFQLRIREEVVPDFFVTIDQWTHNGVGASPTTQDQDFDSTLVTDWDNVFFEFTSSTSGSGSSTHLRVYWAEILVSNNQFLGAASATFGGLQSSGVGLFNSNSVSKGGLSTVLSGISPYHYWLLDATSGDRWLLDAVSGDYFLLQAPVSVGQAIAGLHYPNNAAQYDPATIDPFYDPFNRYQWVNPLDARFDDSTYASVTLNPSQGGYTYVLEVSNFALNIPQFSQIDGIKVEIKRRKTGTGIESDWSIHDAIVQLSKSNGTVVGTNRAKFATEYPTSHAYATYGGETDKWGTTWTAAEVNDSQFGVAFASLFVNQSADFNGTVEVDAIRLTVYFTPARIGQATQTFGGLQSTASGFTLPVRSGAAQASFGGLTTTGTAAFTAPVYSSSATFSFGGLATTATASYSDVVFLSTAAQTFGGLQTTATGFTLPLRSGTAQFTFGGVATTAAGNVLDPVYNGTAAQSFGGLETTGTATVTQPVYSGSAAVTFSGVATTPTAAFSPPVYDSQAAQTFGSVTTSGTATHVTPTYSGSAAVTVAGVTTSGTAAFVAQQFVVATGQLVTGGVETTGTATHVTPTYTGQAACIFGGAEITGLALPDQGIQLHAGLLAGRFYQTGNAMGDLNIGAVIETQYTFIEGYKEIVKIEFQERLGDDLFIGTPAVTEIGKPSVAITNKRINPSLENIDGVVALPGQAVLFDVEVTAAKKHPTVIRIDCDTNNAARSFVVDFVFQTRR